MKKQLFSAIALLAVSTLIVGCKNNGKGGSSEQPEPQPSGEEIVLPTTLEEASVVEFKNLKPFSEEVMEKFYVAVGDTENIEDLAKFGKISEFNLASGEEEHYLTDPTGSFEKSLSKTDVKVYSNDYAEMTGSYSMNYGDKYYQFNDEAMEMEKLEATGVTENLMFFMNMKGEYGENMFPEPEQFYQWNVYKLVEGMPTQYLLWSLMESSFDFYGFPTGYQEVNGLTYYVFYGSNSNSYSYTYGNYYEVDFYQTILVVNADNEVQRMYECSEVYYDHDLFSGEYGMNLREKRFVSLEVKYDPIPTCDAAKRSAFLENMPYYYVTETKSSPYFTARFGYRFAKAVLNDEGKLAAAPSFSGGTNYVSSTFFVDEETLAISFSPSISSSYGDYIALELNDIVVNYLSLRGPTAGTEDYTSTIITYNDELKAAIAEFTGGSILKYESTDYLVIPTYSKGFQGFAITVSAVNPVSTAFGVVAIPDSGLLW